MNKNTKLTVSELIRRKLQIKEAKAKLKTVEVEIESLGGTITITEPSKSLILDITNMDNQDKANKFAIYSCVTDPNLRDKELQQEYDCVEPYDIVDKLFSYGEIVQISAILNNMIGLSSGVKIVEEIKN